MQIKEQTPNGAYKIQELDGTEIKSKIAPFRLLPYIQRDSHNLQQLLQTDDEDGTTTEDVEPDVASVASEAVEAERIDPGSESDEEY